MSTGSSSASGRSKGRTGPARPTRPARRSLRILTVALTLVAGLMVGVPAASQPPPPPFLYPGPGEIVHGTIETAVAFDHPGAQFVDFWIFWESGQFNYARDDDSQVPGEHGQLNTDTLVDGVWQGILEMPPSHPAGPAVFYAEAWICEDPAVPDSCAYTPVAQTEVYADGTPPLPAVTAPTHGTTVTQGDTVDVSVTVDDPNAEGVDLFLAAFFHTAGKGLPKVNQHGEAGAELSGDTDGDGEGGDMSCAPTAAASSLAWFDAHGYPDLIGDTQDVEALVGTVGDKAETGDGGTAPDELIKAIREVVDDAGHGDELEVSKWDEVATDVEDIETEFARGQDVLLGLYWDAGGAHRVAVENIRNNEDGSTDITIMDPWTGDYETVHVDEDGEASQDGKGLEIRKMIHVSPKAAEEESLGSAEESSGSASPGSSSATSVSSQQSGQPDGRTFTATWDTAGVQPGNYLVRAEATDGDDVSLSDWTVVRVLGTGPQSTACEDAPEDGFTDVPAGNIHEAAIDCAVWWGVATGTGPDSYTPGGVVARAPMASFVARLMEATGYDLPDRPADHFDDDNGSTHELRINQLAEAGVIRGVGGRSYGPGQPVDRAQMATFLVAAHQTVTGQQLPRGGNHFTDDDGNTHEMNIDRAAEAGITTGTGNGRYSPGRTVLRDQMGSFLARTLDNLLEEGVGGAPASG